MTSLGVTRAHSWAMMASHFNVFIAFILFMFIIIANAMGFTLFLIHPDFENDADNKYFALANFGNPSICLTIVQIIKASSFKNIFLLLVFVLVNVFSIFSLIIPVYIWKKVWKGSKLYVLFGLSMELFIIGIMTIYCVYHYILFERSRTIITMFSFYFFGYKFPIIFISLCYVCERCVKICGYEITEPIQRTNVFALNHIHVDVDIDDDDDIY